MRRTDPEGQTRCFFRSGERLFVLNGQWFFATREGELGPYRTREEVTAEVARYVKERCDLRHFQLVREQRQSGGGKAVESWEILPIDAPTS